MNKFTIWAKKTPLGWPIIAVVVTGFAATSIFLESINYQKITGRNNLEDLLSGNTLQGEAFWFRYKSNGHVSGYVSRVHDEGTWYVLEDRYCEHWNTWGDGEERCWQLEQNGELIRRTGVDDRSVINEMRLIRHKK